MTAHRRLRTTEALRQLTAENRLSARDFVYPVFIRPGRKIKEAIHSMPGQYRYSSDEIVKAMESVVKSGINALLLFGLAEKKGPLAKEAYSLKSCLHQAVKALRSAYPDLLIMTDVCVCAYTDHGHCGIQKGNSVGNDETLPILSKIALSHAESGADIVAPSAMMDFQVDAIRDALDIEGFEQTGIMAYAAKYFSSFYGPFRDAAGSAPQFGDRADYQMNIANAEEAMREIESDIAEGADIIMVKPALAYLDIIRMAADSFSAPLAAYQVSGEYSMIKAAGEKGWLDADKVMLESCMAIKRAGAGIIISYAAPEIVKSL